MATKIRLPQLKAESLKADMTFKPDSGTNVDYLKLDVSNTKVALGDANIGIQLEGAIAGAFMQDDDSFASPAGNKIASSESIKAYVDAQDAAIASDSLTLTNKTLDANGTGNVISNIDIGNMTAAVIVLEGEGIASNDNDTSLPTSAAVKDYVDAGLAAADLDFSADSGTGAVTDAQTMAIIGTANEINTVASGQQLQIGLPNDVTVGQDLTVTRDLKVSGDLIVEGSKVIVNTKELLLQDHRISMGAPGDFKEGTYTFAQTGSSPNFTHTFTISVANSLNAGDHALVVDPEGNLPSDATYAVSSLSGAGYTITRTNQPNSLTVSGTKAIFACEVGITSNKPEYGSGLFFPAKDSAVSFLYDDTVDRMELVGAGLRVTGESRLEMKVEAHNVLEFHAGGDKQVFTQPGNYGGNKAINIPAANGTLAVSVVAAGGLSLSAAGAVSIDPDDATDKTGTALVASDSLLANVDGDVGFTSIAQIAAYVAGSGAFKQAGSLSGQISAGSAISGVSGFPSLDSSITASGNANEAKHEIYLNGMLMKRSADAALASLSGDYGYRTDGTPGLVFTFDLESGDQIQVMRRA